MSQSHFWYYHINFLVLSVAVVTRLVLLLCVQVGYHPTSKSADTFYIAQHLCIVLDTARTGIGAVVEAVASQPWPAGKQLKVHIHS